ncbi:ralA-binding protein 1-like isoform X2 [Lytechinus variegatus]|uniref:ralA-binding protein 1-like isoform X2 n=1 Tax=Lytechinus variegatus TaxID=7654 RepID=UPI001BB143E8|nr:ralA-binding protein 1-like isoform X2 [Lytechinus variegatus]
MAPKTKKTLKKKDSDSFGEKDPFKLKKEKKDADKKKKEKGYKTFEAAESFSEEDDERGKGKKRGSLFRNRFAPSAKAKPKDKMKGDEKDGKITEERRPSKERAKEDKKSKGSGEEKKIKASNEEKKVKASSEEKKRNKSKEREKIKKKAHTIDVPYVKPEPIFGVPLEAAVARSKLYDNVDLPKIVRECIDYVEEYGLATAGIYRLSGVKSKVEALKAQYNNDEKVNLRDHDPTIVTSLFKLYLRELPDTILTSRFTPVFEHSAGLTTAQERIGAFKKLLAQLPKCNYTLLSWTVVHLAHILERKEDTKMTIQNLSIVMCPTLRISHRTMNLLFTYWKEFFSDVKLKRCPKPLEWIPGTTFEIPDTTAELEEELLRHELILAKMHEELNRGVAHKSTEDNLWEVQRVVTQLKRKLRVSRRVSETRLAAKEKELENKDTKTSSSSSKERSPVKTMSLSPTTLKDDVKEKPVEVEKPVDAQAPEDKPNEPVTGGDEVDNTEEKTEEEPPVKEEEKEECKEESRVEIEEDEEEEKEPEPDLEMMKLLLLSQAEVVAEHDELMNIRNELQKRIEAERQEIANLQSAIIEAKQAARRRGASVDSIDSSVASESSSESEDEEELQKILEGLIRENEELRRKNMQLSHNIHNEREACAELRVQIKLQEQMPQMLEALAQAGIKDSLAKQKSVPKDPSGKPKKVAIVAEPINESSTEKDIPESRDVEDKNENMNSNNSSGVEEKMEEGTGSASSGVTTEKENSQERHLEETAL